jgi:hypothetical protein
MSPHPGDLTMIIAPGQAALKPQPRFDALSPFLQQAVLAGDAPGPEAGGSDAGARRSGPATGPSRSTIASGPRWPGRSRTRWSAPRRPCSPGCSPGRRPATRATTARWSAYRTASGRCGTCRRSTSPVRWASWICPPSWSGSGRWPTAPTVSHGPIHALQRPGPQVQPQEHLQRATGLGERRLEAEPLAPVLQHV